MSSTAIRPSIDEYAPVHGKYVDLVPDGDILHTLDEQVNVTVALLRGAGEERGDFRYAPGKWTLKQSVVHMMDTERIMAYRALRISRGDRTPLPGFDQDLYAEHAPGDQYTLSSLAEELVRLRTANLDLFHGMTASMLQGRGEASGYPVSAHALLWIIAGHERHHVNIIRDRYLAPR